MKKNGVWKAELYRFGYDLVVIGKTKKETEQALREAYIDAYANWNGLDRDLMMSALDEPIRDEDGEVDEADLYNEFASLCRAAFEDLDIRFYEFGKVAWE